MRVRQVTPEDAVALIELFEQLYTQSKYLLYDPGEVTPAVEAYAKRIGESTQAENWVMFVAEDEGRLVGEVGGNRGTARRTRHALQIFIGVLQPLWGKASAARCWRR